MDLDGVVRRRMRTQRLSGPPAADPTVVVRELLAVQAQDVEPSLWSIAMRVTGGTLDEVQRRHDDGELLRTHVLRPTWHTVHRDDLRWLLALTGPRVKAINAGVERSNGLDPATLERTTAVLVTELSGGRACTRTELRQALERAGIEAAGQRLAYIVMHAELTAVICSGARRGAQHTYRLLDELVTPSTPFDRVGGFDRDAALVELASRFFAGHGPSTDRDLAAWASLTLADVRAAIEGAGDRLVPVEVADRTFWLDAATASSRPRRPRSPDVHLLQTYGSMTASRDVHDRTGWFPPNGPWMFFSHVLLGGQLVGQWRRTIGRGRVDLEVGLARPFDDEETAALQAAADRYVTARGLDEAVTLDVRLLPPGYTVTGS